MYKNENLENLRWLLQRAATASSSTAAENDLREAEIEIGEFAFDLKTKIRHAIGATRHAVGEAEHTNATELRYEAREFLEIDTAKARKVIEELEAEEASESTGDRDPDPEEEMPVQMHTIRIACHTLSLLQEHQRSGDVSPDLRALCDRYAEWYEANRERLPTSHDDPIGLLMQAADAMPSSDEQLGHMKAALDEMKRALAAAEAKEREVEASRA